MIDLVLSWILRAPEVYADVSCKQHARLQDRPDSYLLNSNVALYKAGVELLGTFNSVLGLVPRTSKFYERTDLGSVPYQLLQGFVKKGVKAITTLLTSAVPIQDLWLLLIHVPRLILTSDALLTQKKQVGELSAALVKKMDTDPEAQTSLSKLPGRTEFVQSLDQLLRKVYPPNAASERMATICGNVNVEPVSPAAMPAIPSIPSIPSNYQPQVHHKFTKQYDTRPVAQGGIFGSVGGVSDNPFEDQNSVIEHEEKVETVDKVREYADMKFKQCLDYLEELRPRSHTAPSDDLPAVVRSGAQSDQQEFAVLTVLETLLTDNDQSKALKLVHWRKKVLQVAASAGWQTAKTVAARTVERLDISPSDIAAAGD